MKFNLETFVSVDRRRRRWRPRPITWVILAVGSLLVVGALAWGVSHVTRASAVAPVASPTDTDTGVNETSTPPPLPTPPPPAYPATWTVRQAQDPSGRTIGIVDDPVVHEAVRLGFLEARLWAFQSDTPHNLADLERYFAPLPGAAEDPIFQPDGGWWFGLESAREYLAWQAENNVLLRTITEGGEWNVEVQRFSPSGRRAVVRAQYMGRCWMEKLDVQTGEAERVTAEETCWVLVAGMAYDETDGRWKIVTLRQFAPSP